MLASSRVLLAAALSAAALATSAASAAAADLRGVVPDEVIVEYAPGTGERERARVERATGTTETAPVAPRTRVVRVRDGESLAATLAELRRLGTVVRATPNAVARASFLPNDPGRVGQPGGWAELQWNFGPDVGVNAQAAWDNMFAAGRPGGKGVIVAVLDTGVAYSDRGRFRRSPDLLRRTFVRGYDFVSRDRYPNDHNGHGTHVASVIAQATGNGIGVAGLAYGARIMPIRVLDSNGEGDAAAIARGIRFAARRAQVINLSFEFESTRSAREIPDIVRALRYARRRGAVVVAASGNDYSSRVAYPARVRSVVSVGATTEHGCQAEYSNAGDDLDLVAPGGGADAASASEPTCRPLDPPGRDIYQMTFTSSVRRFGLPSGYYGTSMAAPHVSAAAALVIASRVVGRRPSRSAVERQLRATAHDLGPPGRDPRYGAGLVDAAAATARP